MADWPEADELKQVLNVDSDDWQTTLERVRLAAIARVKSDVGQWDELTDEPDENLAQAALRMAELISERPGLLAGGFRSTSNFTDLSDDPTYRSLLVGRRRSFGIA